MGVPRPEALDGMANKNKTQKNGQSLTMFAPPLGDFALAGPPLSITPLDGVVPPPLNPGAYIRARLHKKYKYKSEIKGRTITYVRDISVRPACVLIRTRVLTYVHTWYVRTHLRTYARTIAERDHLAERPQQPLPENTALTTRTLLLTSMTAPLTALTSNYR